MKEDLVILFSGGADSILLMELSKRMGKTPLALLIDYNQLHIKELDKAIEYCKNNNIDFKKVKLYDYNVRSGLTTGEKGIYDGVHEMNVPARNTIFLSIAAGIAESNNIKTIWFGADMEDYYNKFPDCLQDYVGKINELFKISFSYPIMVEAPLLGFSKENVLLLLEWMGVEKNSIYSGYGEFS